MRGAAWDACIRPRLSGKSASRVAAVEISNDGSVSGPRGTADCDRQDHSRDRRWRFPHRATFLRQPRAQGGALRADADRYCCGRAGEARAARLDMHAYADDCSSRRAPRQRSRSVPSRRLEHPSGDARFGLRYRTGPAVIPFASRVRYLAALGACRRRTALGPRLLAAGPASNSTLLSIESNASESFATRFVVQPSSTPLPATGHDPQPTGTLTFTGKATKRDRQMVDVGGNGLSLDERSLGPRPSSRRASSGGIEADRSTWAPKCTASVPARSGRNGAYRNLVPVVNREAKTAIASRARSIVLAWRRALAVRPRARGG